MEISGTEAGDGAGNLGDLSAGVEELVLTAPPEVPKGPPLPGGRVRKVAYAQRRARVNSRLLETRYFNVPAASDEDFEKCNGCGERFKKRGVKIDVEHMREHKDGCEAYQKKVRFD